MRSTSFVVLSVLVHVAIVFAVVFMPTRTVSDAGANVEVSMSEPAAENPGVTDTPAAAAAAEAPAPAAKPQEIAKPVAVTPPVKKQIVSKPAPPVAKVEKKKPTVAASVAAPSEMTEAEVQAEVEKESEPAANEAAPVVATEPPAAEEPAQEVAAKPAPTPVKEVAQRPVPAPVKEKPVAAAAPAAAPAPVNEPAAAPAPSTAPIGVVSTATGTGAEEQETGELAKGGDTKEAAVAVADLKQLAGNKGPKYPMRARIEGRQGDTELVYRVTAEGKVADISIDKSSGSKDLDAEAVKAISNYRFVPGQEGWARHPVSFSLKGVATSSPARLRTKGGAQAKTED